MKVNKIQSLSVFILIFFVCLITSVLAQEKIDKKLKLNINRAIDMALKSSEDFKISGNEILRATSKQKEEQSFALPQITGDVEWSNNFKYPQAVATTTKDYYINAGASISQTLFTFGKISNAIKAAKKAVEASRFSKEETSQEIIYNAKLAYYNTYLAKRILEVAQESYENAKENKKILTGRTSKGRASKYDNIKTSSDIASRIPVVSNARADFVSALESLKVIVDAEKGSTVELIEGFTEEYPSFDREYLAFSLYNNQPAIKALAEEIKEKTFLVKSKRAETLPEVSTFATWNHKGTGNDYYVGGDNLDDYGVAGFKISIPIWLGGLTREALSQARIDKNDAELNFSKGCKDYLLLLDKSINEYEEYKKTLKANEEAVRWAKESFEYSQELFSSGQVSITDLNDAELQLTNAKMNKETTLFNLSIILAKIERLTLIESKNE